MNLTAAYPEDDDEPALSPDGRRIAFRSERKGGALFVLDLEGTIVRRVTRVVDEGHHPAWSSSPCLRCPRSSRPSAPTTGPGTGTGLWGERRSATTASECCTSPYVTGGNGMRVVDRVCRRVRTVFASRRDIIGPPRLTRDGRTMHYSRRATEADLWVMRLP